MTLIKDEALPLPSQEVLRNTNLRPGRNVDLVIYTDLDRDIIDTRSTTLHDISAKGHVILAQPSRPLGPSSKGKQVELTFLGRYRDVPGGRWLRVGYPTRVLGVLQNYKISSAIRESVVVVGSPKELKQYTLRLHYRMEPPPDIDLRLYLEPDHDKVSIVDISAGGVRFSHPKAWNYAKNFTMNLTLSSGRMQMRIKCKVVASYEGGPDGRASVNHTAVRYVDVDSDTRERLGRLMNQLTRHELAKRSGIADKASRS